MQTKVENRFWQFDSQYWITHLNSSLQGLSKSASELILKNQGLRPKNRSGFKKDVGLFVNQFKSPLMLLLIGAVIISAFLGDFPFLAVTTDNVDKE